MYLGKTSGSLSVVTFLSTLGTTSLYPFNPPVTLLRDVVSILQTWRFGVLSGHLKIAKIPIPALSLCEELFQVPEICTGQ